MKKLIILTLLTFFPFSAQAADDTFVADVYVDISADNAAIAKQNAMAEANEKGLVTVVKRITSDSAVNRFEALTPEQIINFIKEIDVVDEKTSDVRYIANLKVKVNEDLLRIYMKEQNMPFIKDTPHDVLIIPIYRTEPHGAPMLFSDENIWLSVWAGKKIKDGSISYYTPKVDPTVNAADIIALDAAAIDKISRENEIEDIHIAEAYVEKNFFIVVLTSYETGLKSSFRIDMTDNENYIDEAIARIIGKVSDYVKKQRMNQMQSSNKITVLYNYSALKDWISIENNLKKSEYVNTLNVDAFGNGKVQFKIEYSGTLESLQRFLQRNGLKLTEHPNKIFILEKIR